MSSAANKDLRVISTLVSLYLSLGILLGLFAWQFYSLFYFTDNFESLIFNYSDDLTFHVTLWKLQVLLFKGEWVHALAVTDYGYGNLYWMVLAISTWCLDHLGLQTAVIVWPRFLALAGYFFSMLAFYKIGQVLGYARASLAQALLLLATCGGFILAATRFHNHTVVAALILWSLYYICDSGKSIKRPVVLFGLALGIKITAVIALPLFLFLLNRPRVSVFKTFQVLGGVLIIALLTFSPVLFFAPQESLSSLTYLFSTRLEGFTKPTMTLFENLQICFFPFYYPALIFVVGLAMSGNIIWRWQKKSSEQKLVALLAVIALSGVLVLATVTRADADALSNYSIPLVFIFSLIFLEAPIGLIPFLIVLALSLNHDNFQRDLLRVHNKYYKAENQIRMDRYDDYKGKVDIKSTDRIVLDHRAYFPLDFKANYKNITLSFTDEMTKSDHDIYVFTKTVQPLVTLSGEVLFEDEFVRVVRTKP